MALSTEREKGAHLLRRFGLGASEAELDYYLKDGLNGAIDKLLAYESVNEGFDVEIEKMANQNGQIQPQSVGVWWTLRLVATQRPLQEKMSVFWHDHFATSASKVQAGPTMHQHNEVLRKNATGNFRTFLTEISQDPAMLFWLDNQYNVAGKPNENFAREVMELFTLGVDNRYTEQDIKEAARAFTGWSIGRVGNKGPRPGQGFVFRPAFHDRGEKTVFGRTGNLTGEQVIDILCELPETAEHITRKVWEWFAYPNPEPTMISRIARKFQSDNLSIKTLLKEIMRSSEFYSVKADRTIYKSPVDFTVSTLRQLGVAQALYDSMSEAPENMRGRLQPVQVAYQSMKSMGMHLLYPPDVAGWETGPNWITSATMMERINWGNKLFGQAKAGGQLRFQSYPIFANDPTPQGVAKKLVSVFDAPIASYKIPKLVEAATKASAGRVTQQNSNVIAAAVTRLIFAAPEYQLM
ncbi:MAG: DUF1800 domain-containing protein [Chlorobia bacterium]|nr:DUF1800 domain-containing protein [Fimbriimonadaceae bacterium]